jgi:hypothetical protein
MNYPQDRMADGNLAYDTYATMFDSNAKALTKRFAAGEFPVVHSLAERPDLLVPALELGSIGAEFTQHDHIGTLVRAKRLAKRWPEFFLVLLDDA